MRGANGYIILGDGIILRALKRYGIAQRADQSCLVSRTALGLRANNRVTLGDVRMLLGLLRGTLGGRRVILEEFTHPLARFVHVPQLCRQLAAGLAPVPVPPIPPRPLPRPLLPPSPQRPLRRNLQRRPIRRLLGGIFPPPLPSSPAMSARVPLRVRLAVRAVSVGLTIVRTVLVVVVVAVLVASAVRSGVVRSRVVGSIQRWSRVHRGWSRVHRAPLVRRPRVHASNAPASGYIIPPPALALRNGVVLSNNAPLPSHTNSGKARRMQRRGCRGGVEGRGADQDARRLWGDIPFGACPFRFVYDPTSMVRASHLLGFRSERAAYPPWRDGLA
eukprot:1194943-Prorocentrum_minimum.AAC.3